MKSRNIFWGLFFIFAAALIVINQMGIYTDFNFFKVAGGLILIAIAIEGCVNHCFPVILFPLAFVAIIFSKELQIQSLSPWPILLVALFASIGLTILFPGRKHKNKHYEYFSAQHCSRNDYTNYNNSGNYNSENYNSASSATNDKYSDGVVIDADYKESSSEDNAQRNNNSQNYDKTCAGTDSNSFVTCSSKFSAVIKYVNTDNFQGADLTAHFGSIKMFFDNAVIQPGTQPVININASFSGIELFVPKNWKLDNQSNSTLGGFEEKNHFNSDNPITVILTGQTSFCGVEITYC